MLWRDQNMLYSTVERRRREMNTEGDVSQDTETDPDYSPKVHLSKGKISSKDEERLFVLATAGRVKYGAIHKYGGKASTSKTKRRGWCPVQRCTCVGAFLPQHLRQVHHLDNKGQTYRSYLKMARYYQGSDEWQPNPSTPSPKKTSPITKPSKRPLEVLALTDDSDSEPKLKRRKIEKGDESSQYSRKAVPPSPPHATTPSVAPTTTPSVAPASGAKVDSEESDSAYEQEVDENEEAYFTHLAPQMPRHRWLVAFYTYLITPAAGFHCDSNRLQHVVEVKILEQLQPSGSNVQVLSKDDGCKVWLDWVLPNLTKRAAGILKSYLNSLQMFLELLLNREKKADLPDMPESERKSLDEVRNSLTGWRRTITKETSAARYTKNLQETENLLTTKEVNDIMTSETAQEGIHALEVAQNATNSHFISAAQYAAARHYILVQLTRSVGRSWRFETATIGQFKAAK
ncbi:uncharacterized protein LOC111328274 [Stylophora pistillata]|uniref:uncharacterized protein LOC111328274 n=1 Tax=Stylophora pistillata TaxID=50429 RepID=UPI000C04D92C|nr:uncharacterized protein LOC111328274 [Stylophora pistillata]